MATKLSDTQLVILSTACGRGDGAVFPITASVKGGALDKVLRSLIGKGLIEEVQAGLQEAAWRHNDDGVRLTLRVTAAGREALGITDDDDPPPSGGAGAASKAAAEPEAPVAKATKGNVGGRRGRKATTAGKGRRATPKAAKAPATAGVGQTRPGTKQAFLIGMLRQKEGATIDEIVAATGWQPHTVRGAMAGALKKRLGLTVTSEKIEGRGRVYRIVA